MEVARPLFVGRRRSPEGQGSTTTRHKGGLGARCGAFLLRNEAVAAVAFEARAERGRVDLGLAQDAHPIEGRSVDLGPMFRASMGSQSSATDWSEIC